MPGKLIVFEGTDGSGKSTQFKLLCDRLQTDGRDFRRLVFPQYDQPSSALLRMYLGGEFGASPSDVNAWAASSFYAVDRYASYKKVWGAYYQGGGLVLADRYTTSNAVHQACKLPQAEWEGFFRWLADYEYDRLGLPRPDLVIFLDMPTGLALENLRRRQAATHTAGDIHETDGAYLALCRQTALAAGALWGWKRVDCAAPDGSLRPVEELHAEILSLLSALPTP